jgi:hypothetical protein
MPKRIGWYELGAKASKREHADVAWKRYFKRWGRSLTPGQEREAKADFYSGFRDAKYRLARTNPASVIPRSWKPAKVRRLKDGRVQVMIAGSSRNPKTGYRVIQGRATRYRWGANVDGKSWIVVKSNGDQVSAFYKSRKMAGNFKRFMQGG